QLRNVNWGETLDSSGNGHRLWELRLLLELQDHGNHGRCLPLASHPAHPFRRSSLLVAAMTPPGRGQAAWEHSTGALLLFRTGAAGRQGWRAGAGPGYVRWREGGPHPLLESLARHLADDLSLSHRGHIAHRCYRRSPSPLKPRDVREHEVSYWATG